MKAHVKNANIEGVKGLRKIAVVGVLTRGRLVGNCILGKRGYLKLSGVDMPWMQLDAFKNKFRYELGAGFYTEKDAQDGPFFFTERASISNTNAYNIWVDNGICSSREYNVLSMEAREGYGNSYIDYRRIGRPYAKLAFAEATLGYDEYDDEDEDYSGE